MVLKLSIDHRVPFEGSLNYDFSNFQNCVSVDSEQLSSIRLDCAEAFSCRSIPDGNESYSTGSTYFAASNQNPRCFLEKLALTIFRFHTKNAIYDPENSGAEWWTQVIDCRDDIGFHWDRDYGLEEDTGQHIHPHLATVTYLTECGGPTIILNKVGTPHTKEDLSGLADDMIVSRPVFGKHIKFDGRLLHAAPSDLLEEVDDEEEDDDEDEENESESVSSAGSEGKVDHIKTDSGDENSESGSVENNGSESDENSSDEAYPKRVTFLVNIWLNHIPIQSKAFPEGRLKHMKSSLESPSLLPSSLMESATDCNLTDKISIASMDSRLLFGGSASIETPSLPIESTATINSETNTTSAIDQHCQEKIWKFSNGGLKYAINIPLPPGEQLNALLEKLDAFRLCYRSSGQSIKIETLSSRKRKLIDDNIPVSKIVDHEVTLSKIKK